jgi:hypothetical protein
MGWDGMRWDGTGQHRTAGSEHNQDWSVLSVFSEHQKKGLGDNAVIRDGKLILKANSMFI